MPTAADALTLARLGKGRAEMVHTLHYFAPSVREAHAALGLDDVRMAYVASRSAPMGAVGPELVQATYYGFAPAFIAAAVPAAWERTTPEQVLATSLTSLGELLAELLTDLHEEVVRAAELARELASSHPILARPLAAAWSAVPLDEDPHVALWQSLTVIRESRGDGHLACLVDAELDGAECHLIARGDHPRTRSILGAMRGWTDAEWDAAVSRLQGRGLLDEAGAPTEAGRALHERIERRTDELAAPAWAAHGAQAEQLVETLLPIGRAIASAGILPGIVVRGAQLD